MCYLSAVIKVFLSSLIIAFALLTESAGADSALYVGELPVQTETGERVPTRAVLNQVLVRLTGQIGSDLVAQMGLEPSQIEDIVLTRQFRQIAIPQPDGRLIEQRSQRIEFDATAVNRLIDQAGLPRWGRERPNMLLWIVVDRDGSADYLSEDAYIDHAIERAAFRYGLNLLRPILDARDRIEVSPSDVRGGFTDVALPAMRRYGASGIVMLDLRSHRNFMTGRWAWRLDELERAFERSGADPAEVIDLGLSRIAAALGNRYAVRAGPTGTQRVVVSGVANSLHYAEILEYLNSLTGIESLRVLSSGREGIEFELVTSTGELESRIALSDLLEFERRDPIAGTLYYRLVW